MRRALAVVPCRGGSKRIPRKNLFKLDGKPMLHYILQAARTSGVFDLIAVATDDDESEFRVRTWGGCRGCGSGASGLVAIAAVLRRRQCSAHHTRKLQSRPRPRRLEQTLSRWRRQFSAETRLQCCPCSSLRSKRSNRARRALQSLHTSERRRHSSNQGNLRWQCGGFANELKPTQER